MTDKDLIKKIKGLRGIRPAQEWLDSTRHNLITQIDFDKHAHFSFNWLKQPQMAALVICLVIIFIGGPWLSMKASQTSLPGELLYSVKKISEDVQATVASDSAKANLQAEFANRRLEELNKITDNSFSPEEKTQKTKQIISDFKDNLAQISQNVSKVPKEGIAAVAERTKKIQENLDKTKQGISSEVERELAEAEKAIEEVKYQILTALVENEQENNQDTASTTEVIIFLKDAIETTT